MKPEPEKRGKMSSCEKCGREVKNYGVFLGGIRCENFCNMNAEQTINGSYEYVGSGTYQCLQPVITEKGFAAGWRFTYPQMLNLNGVNYSMFTTLDDLIADGMIELKQQSRTLV